MPNKTNAVAAGAITLAVGGVTATLTPSEAREWLALLTDYFPLAICAALSYWAYKIDQELRMCKLRDSKCKDNMLTLITIVKSTQPNLDPAMTYTIDSFSKELREKD